MMARRIRAPSPMCTPGKRLNGRLNALFPARRNRDGVSIDPYEGREHRFIEQIEVRITGTLHRCWTCRACWRTIMFLSMLSGILAMIMAAGAVGTAPAQKVDVEAGKQVYTRRCASCHGANGEGRAATARRYGVEMRHLGSPQVQALSDGQWRKLLHEGGMKAKPVGSLSDADVVNVIAYCRTLKQEAK